MDKGRGGKNRESETIRAVMDSMATQVQPEVNRSRVISLPHEVLLWGMLVECWLPGARAADCPLHAIRQRSLAERNVWLQNLSAAEKAAIYERCLGCLGLHKQLSESRK